MQNMAMMNGVRRLSLRTSSSRHSKVLVCMCSWRLYSRRAPPTSSLRRKCGPGIWGPFQQAIRLNVLCQVLHIYSIARREQVQSNGSRVAEVGCAARAVAPTLETLLLNTGKTKEEDILSWQQHQQRHVTDAYIIDDIPEGTLQSVAVVFSLCPPMPVCMTMTDHTFAESGMDLTVQEVQSKDLDNDEKYRSSLIETSLAGISGLLGLVVIACQMSNVTFWLYFSSSFRQVSLYFLVVSSKLDVLRTILSLSVIIFHLSSVGLGSFKHTPELQAICKKIKKMRTRSLARVWHLVRRGNWDVPAHLLGLRGAY